MTERLADLSVRIDGIHQLGAVVIAMKGIAAARARVARAQVTTVDSYAASVATAMSSVIGHAEQPTQIATKKDPSKLGLLVFCAEQGFAGAFSERVLDSLNDNLNPDTLFLIGTRGLSTANARGIEPAWNAAMPSQSPLIPKMADGITKAIYRQVDKGYIDHLNVPFTGWTSGRPVVKRQSLFPIDVSDLPTAAGDVPITQIPLDSLIDSLSADYFHALITKAARHAFAAENQARMEAMSAADSQIERELNAFSAKPRLVRQEAITAEIIELGTGAASQMS
ncbi:MAG: F-type H+-transporting ATPase subunit gamma [Patiriisocius sp.]|jgi:F-type H+-transporting ATPase subunit gamma